MAKAGKGKQHSAALEKNRMQKRILEKRQRAVEDKVAKGKAEDGELDAIVEEIAAFKEIFPIQLYVDDVTPEKLNWVTGTINFLI